MKKHTIVLNGVLADGSRAKTQQVDQVVAFINDKRSIDIRFIDTNSLKVKTAKGSYILPYGFEQNRNGILYCGECGKTWIDIRVKKIVAHLSYFG